MTTRHQQIADAIAGCTGPSERFGELFRCSCGELVRDMPDHIADKVLALIGQ